jgi:hypothetical protein
LRTFVSRQEKERQQLYKQVDKVTKLITQILSVGDMFGGLGSPPDTYSRYNHETVLFRKHGLRRMAANIMLPTIDIIMWRQ